MLEKQHENFVAAVRKWEMLAVTTLKVSGCEKKGDTNTYDISSIKRVTRKFLGVLRCSRAKQQQRNVQKKCAARARLLIRAVVVFCPFSLPSAPSITRFYILFEQTINIIGS